MGKRGSTLIPFLIERLKRRTYGNYLRYVGDEVENVFRVILLRKGKNICEESKRILKDWNDLKGHEKGGFSYTRAKQRFEAALRRSVYLERVPDEQYPFTYKILSSEEIKDKRKKQKIKKSKDVDCYSPLSVESGYSSCVESSDHSSDTEMDLFPCYDESGEESPPSTDDGSFQSSALLAAIQHDHYFGSPTNGLIVQDHEISTIVGMDATDSAFPKNLSGDFATDFSMDDLEWEAYLDDLACSHLGLLPDDLLSRNKDVILKKVSKKVYKFKCEQVLGKTTLLTCEPMAEEIAIDADIDSPDLVVLDADLLERIQRFQITRKVYEDNHLLLFLKPQESSFGNY